MSIAGDRAAAQGLATVKEMRDGDAATLADAANDALFDDDGGVSVCGGKYHIPRMGAHTLYLLRKIDSPLARVDIGAQGADGVAVETAIGIDDLFETLYVCIHQADPRLISILGDRDAFTRAVLLFTATIDMADINELSDAISGQMAKINATAVAEGLADPNAQAAE